MGWFQNKINSWAIGKQAQEFQQTLRIFEGMDDDEVTLFAETVEAMGDRLENLLGIDIWNPTLACMQNPGIVLQLHKYRNTLAKEGNMAASMALLVWIHTLRAATSVELRVDGKKLWRELIRGDPDLHVPEGLDPRL